MDLEEIGVDVTNWMELAFLISSLNLLGPVVISLVIFIKIGHP